MEGVDNMENLSDKTRSLVEQYIINQHRDFSDARIGVEETWIECWAQYTTSVQSLEYIRSKTTQTIGNVSNNWRHRYNLGKVYEAVEMLHSYFYKALFPVSTWFSVEPRMPEYGEEARILKKLMAFDFDVSNFYQEADSFLRQLIILGTSWQSIEWCEENQRNKFRTLDVFDVWVDPLAHTVNDSDLIVRYLLTKEIILKKIDSGEFDWNKEDFEKYCEKRTLPQDDKYSVQTIRDFMGLNPFSTKNEKDKYEVLEYWGDVRLVDDSFINYKATLIGGRLVEFEKCTYSAKPFLGCSYVPIPMQPYGMGAVAPNLGIATNQNSLTCQRSDGIEIAINPQYTLRQNSVTSPDSVYSEPGKVHMVEEHGDLQPLQQNVSQLGITYEELRYLETVMDRNFGTIPLVGLGQARKAERVTKAEIEAVQNAGGTRLLNIHNRIERTWLKAVLKKCLENYVQFMSKDKIIRIAGGKAGEFKYYQVSSSVLKEIEYYLKPNGAESVIDRQGIIDQVTSFAGFIGSVPTMAEHVDWEALTMYVLQNWGFEEPEAFIKKQEPVPTTPIQDIAEETGGGAVTEGVLNSQQMAGGAEQWAGNLTKAMNAKVPQLDYPAETLDANMVDM